MTAVYVKPGGATVEQWPDKPLALGCGQGRDSSAAGGFRAPPYGDPSEVVLLIKLALMQRYYHQVETVRAVESGVVEEQAVVAVEDTRKTLIVRIWPVFYAHPKRVEYRFYLRRPPLETMVLAYLRLLATVNQAELVEKR